MSAPNGMLTDADQEALAIARGLVRAGMPLFLATPDASEPTGFRLPARWQQSAPDLQVVNNWRPGLALCAVTGHVFDVVDIDPRSGGGDRAEIPQRYGVAETPSGGTHYFVAPLDVASRDGAYPGIDVKSGTKTGQGRGFAFIAPTVRRSKTDGTLRQYRWAQAPYEGDGMEADHTGDRLRARIIELRAERAPTGLPRRIPASVARAEWDRAYERLVDDLRHWAANGWGGEAHAGLLAHTTHLARLSPEHALEAYLAAFTAVGIEADDDDLTKVYSAIDNSVPDVVVPDADMPPQELFWAGARVEPPDPKAEAPADPMRRDGAGPFQFLTEEEAGAIPLPDPLMAGLLYCGTKARLFGESTKGKTWLALDWAAHVANGMPWMGREVREGPVLYVAAEGAPSFAPRMRTWALAHGRSRSRVRFWPEAVQVGGEHWDAFVAAVEREGFVLVIGDTQSAMTVGRKEDSNDDAGIVQAALSQLVASKGSPCYLGVHHVGWADQGRPRGASAMFGAMDTELRLGEGRRGLVLVSEKQRYAVKAPPVGFRLVAEHDGLVVRPIDERDGGSIMDEHDVMVSALVARVQAHVASGGKPPTGYRTMHELLNKTLRGSHDEPVTEAVSQDVNRAYQRSVGTVV